MILLFFKVLIIGFVATVATAIGFLETGLSPYVFALIIAGLTLFSNEIINHISFVLNEPKIEVSMNEEVEGELNIKITKKGGTLVKSFSIEAHTLGPISGVHDLNDKTSYGDIKKEILGEGFGAAQNTLSLLISDISGDRLQYKVLYAPVNNFFVAGHDVYKYRYIWSFGGSFFSKEKVKSKEGREITEGNIIVKAVKITNRALSEEEIVKSYKEGPPKRTLDN